MGNHSPLQGIFPTQGANPCLLLAGGFFTTEPESACQAGELFGCLGLEDPLKKGMATHSHILAWEIPCTKKPAGFQSIGLQKSQTQLSTCNNNLGLDGVRIVMGRIDKMLEMPKYMWLPAAAKSLQSCLTLRDPIDSSPPGSPVPGILQTRTLEWVAISFSNA